MLLGCPVIMQQGQCRGRCWRANRTTGNGYQDWPHSVLEFTVMRTARSPTGQLFIYLFLLLVLWSFSHTSNWSSLLLLCKGKGSDHGSAASLPGHHCIIYAEKPAPCLLGRETPQALPGASGSAFTELFCTSSAIAAPGAGRRAPIQHAGLITLAQLPSVPLLLCDYSC